MAFKMKGVPKHDLSSKHGTNANFKKSGPPLMKGLGKLAGNFIKGKGAMGLLNPVGAIANKMGAFGKGDQNQVQTQNTVAQATQPPPPPTAAAPVPTPEEQGVVAPTMMKKGLKNGAPMKEAAKVTKAQLQGKKVIAVDDGSEMAKKHKADYEAKQAKKAAKAKKKADSKKVSDDAMKYHQEQAKAQGMSWPEYKRKLKKRTRGY